MDALSFMSMNEEDQKKQLYDDCISTIDSHLRQIFIVRALQLNITPEKKNDIDEFITSRSRELIDECDSADDHSLFLSGIIGSLK